MSDKKKAWVMTEARQKAWEKCQAMRKAQCDGINKERQIKRLTAREKKIAEKKADLLGKGAVIASAEPEPPTVPTPVRSPAVKKKKKEIVTQAPVSDSESESDSSIELIIQPKVKRTPPQPFSPSPLSPAFRHVFL